MKPIDAWASHGHLVDHIAPIWRDLPSYLRGTFCVASRALVRRAGSHGVVAELSDVARGPGGPVIVANRHDLTETHGSRPVIFLEHGAGQTYLDHPGHPSYSGGTERDRVSLFLTLNDRTAARERAVYPDAEVRVVGCPKLDPWTNLRSKHLASDLHERPVVTFCWHWDCHVFDETRETFTYWRYALRALHETGDWHVLGHGHPRIYDQIAKFYDKAGIERTDDFAEVLARADVVAFDNSSAGYEAAAAGIPVLALNAPWYRRDVHHGLRFWDLVPGPQIDEPDQLAEGLQAAMAVGPDPVVVDEVYPAETRGRATRLAVDAILDHVAVPAGR